MTAPKLHPTDLVMSALIAFLMPMLLPTTGRDLALARATAIQAVKAFAARNPAELLLVGESIALGLAVIDSISLSMGENIPISLILRLRANAVSLHRAAQQCRRALAEAADATAPPQDAPLPDAAPQQKAEIIANLALPQAVPPQAAKIHPETRTPAPKPPAQPTPTTEDQYFNAAWAAAMSDVAEEMTAGIDNLPPDEQKAARIRVAALNATASHLNGTQPHSR
jgi:hypothetical protein